MKGKVKQLKSENEKDGSTNYLVVEADVGDILFLEAYRESIYIHGHWMGKADLNYVLEEGKYQETNDRVLKHPRINRFLSQTFLGVSFKLFINFFRGCCTF